MIRFINRLLMKAIITMAAFVIICGVAKIDPVQVIVKAKQGYDTVQNFKDLSNNTNTNMDMSNSNVFQSFFDKLNNIISK